jgi:hypothetical protein
VNAARTDYGSRLEEFESNLGQLVRRLRGLSAMSWSRRRDAVEEALGGLEAITAALDDRPLRAVPEIPNHALADALDVIGADASGALHCAHDDVQLDAALALIRAALDVTR